MGPETAQSDDPADEVYLYDAIGSWFGMQASDLINALKATTSQTVELRINCPGGDVFDARAVVAAIGDLRRQGRTVNARVDGLAASAASWIALACTKVQMQKGSFMMIHNSWTVEMGDAAQMLSTAALLEKLDAACRADYAAKTGKSDQELKDMMAAETWMEAQQAVDQGFADEVLDVSSEDDGDDGDSSSADDDTEAEASQSMRRRLLDSFKNAPASLRGKPARAVAKADKAGDLRESNERHLQMLEHLAPRS